MSGYTDLTKLESSRNCLRRIARHDELQFSKDSIVNMMEKFVKTVNIMDDTILVPCRLMDRQVGDSTDIVPAPGKDYTANQLMLSSSAHHGKRGITHSKNVHEFLSSSELFNLYSMLNSLKNDLLWTGKDQCDDEADLDVYTEDDQTERLEIVGNTATVAVLNGSESKTESSNSTNAATAAAATTNTTTKGHIRRPSTASVASTASVSNLSDSESEISNENDSGMESEGNNKSDNRDQSSSSSAGSISSSSDDGQTAAKKKASNGDKATELAQRCRRHLNGLYQCLEQMTEAANYLTARYQSDIGPV